MDLHERWQAPFDAAASPSRAEVIAAKTAILDVLADGETHDRGDLLTVHAEPDFRERDKVDVAGDPSIDELRGDPLIVKRRRILAAAEGLSELHLQGVVVPQTRPGGGWNGEFDVIRRVGLQHHGQGSGVNLTVPCADTAASYRLHGALRDQPSPRSFDSDLFTADLDDLRLDPRTVRCIREALDAYARGLYLAAANLVGAAVEGAWFAAAEVVASASRKVADELAEERPQIGRVQKAMVGWMRSQRTYKHLADDLEAHANLIRELRNYGAHPRSAVDHHLEDHFTEVAAAILIMGAHRHLRLLSEVKP